MDPFDVLEVVDYGYPQILEAENIFIHMGFGFYILRFCSFLHLLAVLIGTS